MTIYVSLSANGLKIANPECPNGGTHDVPAAAIELAAKQGGGPALCVKCRQMLHLEKA